MLDKLMTVKTDKVALRLAISTTFVDGLVAAFNDFRYQAPHV